MKFKTEQILFMGGISMLFLCLEYLLVVLVLSLPKAIGI